MSKTEIGDRDEVELRSDSHTGHIALRKGCARLNVWRKLCSTESGAVEHGLGQVDTDNCVTAGGEVESDPPGSAPKLENRAARINEARVVICIAFVGRIDPADEVIKYGAKPFGIVIVQRHGPLIAAVALPVRLKGSVTISDLGHRPAQRS